MHRLKNHIRLYPVSTNDLARVLSISVNYVNVLVHRRVLTRNADGLFDLSESVPAYIRHREAGLKATWSVDAAARVRLTNAKADLAELKLKKLQQELAKGSRLE